MLGDDRVPPDRGKRCHIQGTADFAPTAGDGSFAAHLCGVAVDRRGADQASNTAAIERTEFGQIGDQGVGGDAAGTRNRGQQIIGGAPDW